MRTREELIRALTVGAGLLAQGLSALGDVLHQVGQAFENLSQIIENQIVSEMESEFEPLETESDDMEDPPDYDHTDEDDLPPPGEPPVNP